MEHQLADDDVKFTAKDFIDHRETDIIRRTLFEDLQDPSNAIAGKPQKTFLTMLNKEIKVGLYMVSPLLWNVTTINIDLWDVCYCICIIGLHFPIVEGGTN